MRDGHDERGRFVKGAVANPNGRNGHRVGWQPYGHRAKYWLTHITTSELCEIVTDERNTRRLSTYDVMIANHIHRCIFSEDRRIELERLLNSIEGKPKRSNSDAHENLHQASSPHPVTMFLQRLQRL